MFYDSKTGKAVTAKTTDEMVQKVVAGEASPKKGQSYNVLDTEGKSFSIDGNELRDALQSGYKLESPDQLAVREYVKDNEGIKGALKVGAGQFLDEALGGVPELIYDKTADELERAKKDALKDAHDISNVIGGVAGFGASLFGGGPLAKLGGASAKAGTQAASGIATKIGTNSVAKRILGNVAQKSVEMGVEGAVFAAPLAITEAALGDLDLAAETLLWSGGLGAAFGGGGALLKEAGILASNTYAAKKAKEALAKDDVAFEIIGATPTERAKIKANKAVYENLPDFLTKKAELGLFDDATKIEENVKAVRSKAGKTIGDIVENVNATAPLIEPVEAYGRSIDKLQVEADRFAQIPGAGPIVKQYDDQIAELRIFMNRDQVSIKDLNDRRKALDEVIYAGRKDPTQSTKGEILSIIRKDIDEVVGEHIQKHGSSTSFDAWKDAKLDYSIASSIIKPLSRKSSANNNPLRLTNLILGTGGFSAGGIEGAAVGLAIGAANRIRPNAILLAEKHMGKLAKELDSKIGGMFDGARRTVIPVTYEAMKHLVGEEGDDRAKLNRLQEKVSEYVANPSSFENEIAKISDPMSEDAPEVAGKYSLNSIHAMKYIDEIIPRSKRYENPIFKSKRNTQISDAELNKFRQQLEIIYNPLKAVDALASGSLTKSQVGVLERLYPRLLDNMRSRITDNLMANPEGFTYADRLKFNRILGVGTDYSLNPQTMKSIQSTFSSDQAANPKQPSNGYKNGSIKIAPQKSALDELKKGRS